MASHVYTAAALAAALFLAPANAQASPQAALPSAEVTTAVDDVVARYELPGIAVGVVVDGKVRQWEVRGETTTGSGERVRRDTLFKVASNTKAMTAALLARQVDAGLLSWDDPVVKHLPGFRMHEDWVTREMQVRDLLIHNSGLGPGAGDLMLWPEPNHFTREDVIAGLKHLKPRWSFRSRYAYDNTLYIVAGEVAAAVGGAPYDVLLRREVFEPLGMDGCRIGEWRVADAGSVAAPHVTREGKWAARLDGEVVTDMPMAAAGGVRCNLDSMLRWTQAWLGKDGNGSGTDWLSTQQRKAVWTPHMPMPLSPRMRDWNGSHFYAYGYGWRLSDVDGTSKVAHTGTLSGMYSAVTLLPELDTGFVILINAEAGEARTVLEQVLSKHFTAPGEKRTVAYYADELARERSARHSTPAEDPPVIAADARASASRSAVAPGELASWLGEYRDPWFGDVSICASESGVRFQSVKSPRLSGPVLDADGRLLVDFDTLESDADAWLDFAQPSAAGGPHPASPQLTMAKVDPDADFSYDYEDLHFQRIGDCAGR
ncbi:serine hydrolase [Lysobacter sp. H21R4]|uniref:serine hydrolase n=1 Tax=Lysobacter sp. H21R4 TaxID=2781021 RepID=UPI001889850D|nr:serine hydrolase [Lysobacter sp. H21R4]QOY63849.1 serine hydrolase [Lysobacter sp. H21R4]